MGSWGVEGRLKTSRIFDCVFGFKMWVEGYVVFYGLQLHMLPDCCWIKLSEGASADIGTIPREPSVPS